MEDIKQKINGVKDSLGEIKKNPKNIANKVYDFIKKSSFFWGPQQNDIGVSIGHQNIIAVELDKTQEVPHIKRLAVHEITQESADISEILRQMFHDAGFSNNCINTSLSGKSVIVRFIKFPKMNKKELRSALAFEAEKYIPFDINDVYLDFDILDSDTASKKYLDIALVAAKKDAVHQLLSNCKDANLSIKVIDNDSFACFNSFLAAYPEEKMKTTALINIGAKLTNLMIVYQGLPAFSRDLYFGGDDITLGLSKKLQVDIKEATKLKYNLKTTKNANIKTAISEILHYLMTEIRLSFDYFETQTQKEKRSVEDIYIIGGSSQLEGLVELIEETLKIKTVHFEPLRCIILDDSVDKKLIKQYEASLAVPIGLAIR